MTLEEYCKKLEQRVLQLEKENASLRGELGIPEAREAAFEASSTGAVNKHSSPDEKIRLFRGLFQGREDVFAKRWYSVKTEKSGYSPVCANEWREGVCIKPKGSCSKCEHRESVPLGEAVLYQHLSGKDPYGRDVVGIYPILSDDTCWFLAIDFDDGHWRQNVSAVRGICDSWNVPCAVERSRSGEGAHLWIFFSEPISCSAARKLGAAMLTAAMETSGVLKLDSYDRMFPNQDTLPKGGFGNLIALPLQGRARKMGNSSFVDEQFEVIPDQWAYLSQLQKITAAEVDSLAKLHGKGDGLGALYETEEEAKPWDRPQKPKITAMDIREPLTIVRSNMLYIPESVLTPRVRSQFLRLAAFKNPDFYRAQAMRLPTYHKPRVISTAEERDGCLALPRGCEESFISLLDEANAVYEIIDKTNPGKPIHVQFKGALRPEQQPALNALLEENTGVLSTATAFGKTVIAAALIGSRKTNTLILVHTQALLNQWMDSLTEYLEIREELPELPKKRGRKKTVPSLANWAAPKTPFPGLWILPSFSLSPPAMK